MKFLHRISRILIVPLNGFRTHKGTGLQPLIETLDSAVT